MMQNFPEHSCQLGKPVTREVVREMLRNRRYTLEETRLKKDKGKVRVYMCDRWADPMLVEIGEYWVFEEPDWAVIYDRAMARHLENKELGRDREREEIAPSSWLPGSPSIR